MGTRLTVVEKRVKYLGRLNMLSDKITEHELKK